MKKKIISLCLVIALVATAIAGATLAYFTDVTEVNTNTFTVGDVQIKLDEAEVGEDGQAIDPENRVTKNSYDNIYPGLSVDKDPTVSFVLKDEEGNEINNRDCFVRMIVTLDDAMVEALKTAFPANDDDFKDFWKGDLFLLEKLVEGYDETVWVVNEENTEVGRYEFWYKEMVPAGTEKLDPLFTNVVFPEEMTNEQIGALNNFVVEIVAHAMQADGFVDAEGNPSQTDAWAAWPTEG